MENLGKEMYGWAVDLFPINRSLTGDGVRQTLQYIKNIIPEMEINEVPSGTKCFDWTVPQEWNCDDAYILDPDGNKICDFKINNLHVVGYSTPIDKEVDLDELKEHLYWIEDQPTAIPYITSYYSPRWGFCLSFNEFKKLKKGTYKVKINSELIDGSLTYGEVKLKGESDKEIFLSTYVCHPSMANNELSGPVVTTALVKFIKSLKDRKYSYRIVFIPETIGSITYISRNIDDMKKNIIAGFNISCVGDDRCFSYVPSRYGNSLSDKVSKHVLKNIDYVEYSFLDRGSDERQYCSPGVDLPIATICRTKYGQYPEYHTSLDDLTLISPTGLYGGYEKLMKAIELLEKNNYYKVNVSCEPQLGKRGLYPTISTKETGAIVRDMMNFIAYADGNNDLIDIANIIGVQAEDLYDIVDDMKRANLIEWQ
ncbi:MAG: aminopeptidase [Candidatus Pelagibacter sp.]|nr:aminopeptidase [Candidatus Pelagibacter sp.]|tara:strand:+ start:4071 stop:5345 length:1275 start_codon:yes stop_codon:yes gene_type:complete